MKIIVDVDNTLFNTSKYVIKNDLIPNATRQIPYWNFKVDDIVEAYEKALIFKTVPLKELDRIYNVWDFLYSVENKYEVEIVTGRDLTDEDKEYLLSLYKFSNFVTKQNFTLKMSYIDSCKSCLVIDDLDILEPFIRNLYFEGRNIYYAFPLTYTLPYKAIKCLQPIFESYHLKYQQSVWRGKL